MKRGYRAVAAYGLIPVIAVGLTLAGYLLGISAYVITGGSMTGEISKGSLAIDRSVPVGDLQVGDVITFQPPGVSGNVTHRITEITTAGDGRRVLKTKGDFNEAEDPWVFTLDRPLVARYLFNIPWLGYVLGALTLRVVRTVVLGMVGLLILAVSISWLRTPMRRGGRRERAGMTLYRTGEMQR